jgi:hypothetical protein
MFSQTYQFDNARYTIYMNQNSLRVQLLNSTIEIGLGPTLFELYTHLQSHEQIDLIALIKRGVENIPDDIYFTGSTTLSDYFRIIWVSIIECTEEVDGDLRDDCRMLADSCAGDLSYGVIQPIILKYK